MVVGGTGTEVKGMSFGLGGASRNSSRSVRHNPHDCLFGVSSPSKVRDMITENISTEPVPQGIMENPVINRIKLVL